VSELTHYEPSFVRWEHPDGGQPTYTLYYGVPDGACERLEVGATFSMVYSPNPYWKERDYWRLTVYEVVMSYPRWRPKDPGEIARMYRERSMRALDEAEVAHVVGIIEGIVQGRVA